VDTFGESAPAPALFEHFGLTAARLAARVTEVLQQEDVDA
jgi:transketolase